MKHSQRHVLLAAALATGVAFALPPTQAAAFAGDNVAAADQGFIPNTGQINRGFDPKVPTMSQPRPMPTLAEARAAKLMPDSDQPAFGAPARQPGPTPGVVGDLPNPEQKSADTQAVPKGSQAGTKAPVANATNGSGSESLPAAQAGPIGATGQTMPSKFSQRNDTLDRVPLMAQPSTLSDQDRQHIYQAAMADKTPAAGDADQLAPSSALSTNQALNETHPLPASVNGIPGVQALAYVKTKDKVFLVEPATRTVVDEIGS